MPQFGWIVTANPSFKANPHLFQIWNSTCSIAWENASSSQTTLLLLYAALGKKSLMHAIGLRSGSMLRFKRQSQISLNNFLFGQGTLVSGRYLQQSARLWTGTSWIDGSRVGWIGHVFGITLSSGFTETLWSIIQALCRALLPVVTYCIRAIELHAERWV